MYTQSLPFGHKKFNHIADDEKKESGYGICDGECQYGLELLKACAFGNRFLTPRFERITHNHYVNHVAIWDTSVAYEEIIFAWKNFGEDSSILDMMVEAQCLLWSARDDSEDEARVRLELPKEFLIRVMLRLAALRDDRDCGTQMLEAEKFFM